MKKDKLYFKWNKNLCSGKFKLDDFLSKEIIENEFEKEERFYTYKSNSKIKLKLDNQSRIILIHFSMNATIAGIELTPNFIEIIKEKMSSTIEPCTKEYKGDQLILNFRDSILYGASLVKRQNN